MNVALLGTGLLGQAVAARLHATGHRISAYNRSPEKTVALRQQGIHIASTAAEAIAAAEVVILLLADAAATRVSGLTGTVAPNTRCSSSVSDRLSASPAPMPAARTARKYFETAPIDSPTARACARTLKLLACSPISCFNFDMEILSFGIDYAPRGKTPKVTQSATRSISSRRPSHPRS